MFFESKVFYTSSQNQFGYEERIFTIQLTDKLNMTKSVPYNNVINFLGIKVNNNLILILKTCQKGLKNRYKEFNNKNQKQKRRASQGRVGKINFVFNKIQNYKIIQLKDINSNI